MSEPLSVIEPWKYYKVAFRKSKRRENEKGRETTTNGPLKNRMHA
jgi:hypothetical protein